MSSSGKRFLSEAEKAKKPKTGMDADWNFISRLYRNADDKHGQIVILSELYACSEKQVAEYLYRHGYTDKYIKKVMKKK